MSGGAECEARVHGPPVTYHVAVVTSADDGFAGGEAARLNELLRAAGFTDAAVTLWWDQLPHRELEGRTAGQAWLAGDRERVTDLVKSRIADGTAERDWAARVRAEVAAGGFKGRLAAQASPRAVVDQWRAGRTA